MYFGPPVTFALDRGITDKNWRAADDTGDEPDSDVDDLDALDGALEQLDDELTLLDELEEADL